MTTLFFLLLLIPFLGEISDMLNPSKMLDRKQKLEKYNKMRKEAKEKQESHNENTPFEERMKIIEEKNKLEKKTKESLGDIAGTCGYLSLYMILTIIGMIMSSQWILFTVITLIGIMSAGIKRISKNIIYLNTITVIDSAICATILLYIIINHFHGLNLIPLDLKGFVGMFV